MRAIDHIHTRSDKARVALTIQHGRVEGALKIVATACHHLSEAPADLSIGRVRDIAQRAMTEAAEFLVGES